MPLLTVRRLAAATATALTAGLLAAGSPAQADTTAIDYNCSISGFPLTFSFVQRTDAPPSLYVGQAFTPTYQAVTSFSSQVIAFARTFGADSFEGSVDATVLVNGTPTTVNAPIPRTQVPGSGPLILTATGPMAALLATGVGSTTYRPGDIKFSVTAYRADESELFSTGSEPADCVMPANTQKIDTVSYVKSPTQVAATVKYVKPAKKAIARAKVTATSGAVPTGTVTFALFKGKKKVKTAVAEVASGQAKVVFKRLKATGRYRVVSTYTGSTSLKGARAAKGFTVR